MAMTQPVDAPLTLEASARRLVWQCESSHFTDYERWTAMLDDPGCDEEGWVELRRSVTLTIAALRSIEQATFASVEARLRAIGNGPFTGDGVLGPLHAVGLASGFKWAADVVRDMGRARLPERGEGA